MKHKVSTQELSINALNEVISDMLCKYWSTLNLYYNYFRFGLNKPIQIMFPQSTTSQPISPFPRSPPWTSTPPSTSQLLNNPSQWNANKNVAKDRRILSQTETAMFVTTLLLKLSRMMERKQQEPMKMLKLTWILCLKPTTSYLMVFPSTPLLWVVFSLVVLSTSSTSMTE